MTGKQWAAFGIWFIVIWSAVILRRLWKIHRLGGKITRESIRPYSKRLFIVTPLLTLFLAFILSAATSIKKFIFMICVFGFFASPIFILILRDKLNLRERRMQIPDYSVKRMRNWIMQVYTALQKGWQEKDLSDVRKYLHERIFHEYDQMLDKYRQQGETNIVNDIIFSDICLSDVQQVDAFDVLEFRIKTVITDYVVNDATGNLVRGSRFDRLHMTYKWMLRRQHDEQSSALYCSSCGTTAEVGRDTACPCCGKPIIHGRFDWIITEIECLGKRTLHSRANR